MLWERPILVLAQRRGAFYDRFERHQLGDTQMQPPPCHMNRRTVLSLLALALAAAHAGRGAAAEAWPSKTVRIIVPFAPGGGADSSARVLAEVLAPQLGQSVIVENRPGAGSAIGVMAAAQSKDGHTLLMGSNSMVINPVLNPADRPTTWPATSTPWAWCRRSRWCWSCRPRRRSRLRRAGRAGEGAARHSSPPATAATARWRTSTAELFSIQTKTSITSVPYKGESALMPDLIAGLVAAASSTCRASSRTSARAGCARWRCLRRSRCRTAGRADPAIAGLPEPRGAGLGRAARAEGHDSQGGPGPARGAC